MWSKVIPNFPDVLSLWARFTLCKEQTDKFKHFHYYSCYMKSTCTEFKCSFLSGHLFKKINSISTTHQGCNSIHGSIELFRFVHFVFSPQWRRWWLMKRSVLLRLRMFSLYSLYSCSYSSRWPLCVLRCLKRCFLKATNTGTMGSAAICDLFVACYLSRKVQLRFQNVIVKC